MPSTQTIVSVPEIPSKPVQDILLAAKGENVPNYFTRESNNPTLAAGPSAHPWPECPVIDLSLLSSSSHHDEELKKLHYALVSWGSFQIVNHGMKDSFLDEIRGLVKEFFLLPYEERQKYSRTQENPEGYGNDTILSKDVPHNWNDRLFLKVYPEHARNLSLWPQNPSNFREMLHDFTMKIQEVNEKLLVATARCLGLEDKSFFEESGDINIASRINFYPKCPFPELVKASRAHTDASIFTFLLPDKQVDGLQLLKDDKWFKVPIIPSALFINSGDLIEIMSNGIIKAAVHRVIANPEKERLSIAMFFATDQEKEFGPIKKLVNENQPALYKRTSRYLQLFFKHHPKGESPLNAVKL